MAPLPRPSHLLLSFPFVFKIILSKTNANVCACETPCPSTHALQKPSQMLSCSAASQHLEHAFILFELQVSPLGSICQLHKGLIPSSKSAYIPWQLEITSGRQVKADKWKCDWMNDQLVKLISLVILGPNQINLIHPIHCSAIDSHICAVNSRTKAILADRTGSMHLVLQKCSINIFKQQVGQ